MRQVAFEVGGTQLNRNANLHDQGLVGLLKWGTGLTVYSRFLDAGGNMGETLKVKPMFPAKSPAEERCKQGSAWGGLLEIPACWRDGATAGLMIASQVGRERQVTGFSQLHPHSGDGGDEKPCVCPSW